MKKDEKTLDLPPGAEVEVTFLTPPRLEGEFHQGEIKLSGTPDPLEFDDKRFFTFKVRPALKVLFVSDLAFDSEFVAAALDPDPPPRQPRLSGRSVRPAELVTRYRDSFSDYASVFLLNVRSSTKIPGACSTVTSARAAAWSSVWATGATPETTTSRSQARSCPPRWPSRDSHGR